MIEKLDGFTVDGRGNVIGGEADLVAGDVCRVDGKVERRWYPPAPPSPPSDIDLNRKALRAHVITALGGNGVGSAKLQSYIDAAVADTSSTTAGQNRRYALEVLRQDDSFSKTEATQIMTAMQFILADRQAVLTSWPQA